MSKMPSHARRAFNALKEKGAPVYDRQEHDARFILGAELRTAEDTYWADYYGEEIRESWNDDRTKILNAFGIRTEVHDILEANGLFAHWINPGMVGIYDQ